VGNFASELGVIEKVALPGSVFIAILLVPIGCYILRRWWHSRKKSKEIQELRRRAALLDENYEIRGPKFLSLFCRSCDPEVRRQVRPGVCARTSSYVLDNLMWVCHVCFGRRFCDSCTRTLSCVRDESTTKKRPINDSEYANALEAVARLNELYPCTQSAKNYESFRLSDQMKGK
jgi:hypothetical protein